MTAQSQSPDSIGGRYRIEELLGRGATGEVYRVVDSTDDRTLAIAAWVDAKLREALGEVPAQA